MSLEILKYVRKSFPVDVVRVTEDNIELAAEWCGGDVRMITQKKGGPEEKYVKVRVYRPSDDRQTMAFVGDRILYAGTGYKVYTPSAFDKSFELASEQGG